MLLWFTAPTSSYAYDINPIIIIILAVASLGVYGTLGAGWRSNSKYRLLGAIRAVAQTISYEVSLTVVILGSVLYFYFDLGQEKLISAIAWAAPLTLMIMVRVLAEANRSPFDFAEGESELVSGFNTEYSSVLFVLVFLAEYIAIIFISVLCSMLFLAARYAELLAGGLAVGFFYIWARGTLPRFRYDQLMYLAWKVFLPLALLLLLAAALL